MHNATCDANVRVGYLPTLDLNKRNYGGVKRKSYARLVIVEVCG